MIVERYSDKYRDDIKRVVQSFQNESLVDYWLSFDADALSKTINELKDQAFMLVMNGRCEGLLAGKKTKTPLSDDPIWHEVIWYVMPKHRKYGMALLKKAREILKSEGFKAMIMVCMHNSKTEKLFKLYNKMGFVTMETHFIGRL